MHKPSQPELTAIANAVALQSTTRKLVRGGPRPMALEQRFMFDGAAASDLAHIDATAFDASRVLEVNAPMLRSVNATPDSTTTLASAQAEARRWVFEFLQRPDAREQLFALFNGGQEKPSAEWTQAADNFLVAMRNGTVSVQVELRSNSEMQGALGAFAAAGPNGQPTIYLNRNWIASDTGVSDITRVLVEEFGHSIDARLNGSNDTPGDEGQRFSAVVARAATDPLTFALDDDHATLQLDGQSVSVEMATYTFVNAYAVNTATTLAEKEQNNIDFTFTGTTASVVIQDGTGNLNFSGNDVSAIGLNINGTDYYGWISRPIKVGGVVKGFYFWTDAQFVDLPTAQLDGNRDTDGTAADNSAFVLVVDQAYFNGLGFVSGSIKNVGSSSDRVDTALNSLLTTNTAPVAVADTTPFAGTPDAAIAGRPAQEAGGALNATASIDATGNVLTNDTDVDSGDTKTVTFVGTSSASNAVTGGTTSANGQAITGQWGTLTLGSNGTYRYHITSDSDPAMQALLAANSLTDTFTYTMKDAAGLTSTTTLTITIKGANDAPIAFNDYNTAKESLLADTDANQYTSADALGVTAVGNVLRNDTDVDRYAETASIVGFTSTGTAGAYTAGTSSSQLTFTAASTLSPVSVGDKAYVSIAGVFTALYDSGGANITVTSKTLISGSDYAIGLSASPAFYYKSGGNQAITAANLDNTAAADIVGFTAKTATSGPSGIKSATVSSVANTTASSFAISSYSGTIAVGMSATWAGYAGNPVTVTGVTYDGAGNVTAVSLTSTTTLNATNLPSSTGITFSASAGSNVTGRFGTLALAADGSYVYTPFANNASLNSGQTGIDSFKYTMQDAAAAQSTATLYITVSGSSAADPNAISDAVTATEAGGTLNGTAGVNPVGNVITGVITTGTGSGAADTTPINTGPDYVIAGRANGDSSDSSATYVTTTGTIANGSKSTLTVASTAGISTGWAVAGTNIAAGTTVTVVNATTLTLSSPASSAVAGGTSFLFIQPTAAVTLTGQYGSLALQANGSYTYTLDNNNVTVQALNAGSTALQDVFTYRISNGQYATGVMLTDTANLTVTINGANDAPVAGDNTATAIEGGGSSNIGGYNPSGNVLLNDTDVDDASSALRVTAIRTGNTENAGTAGTVGGSMVGSYGTLTMNADGTWSYAVDNTNTAVNDMVAGGTLVDYFNYTVKDGSGTGTGIDYAKLTITINGANDTVAVNSIYVNEASPYATFTVTGGQGVGVTLALSTSTGLASSDVLASLGTDTANAGTGVPMQYFNGTSWVDYTPGNTVRISSSGTLFVRTAITQDSVHEGNESFTLLATADAAQVVGIGTINDEGAGDIFLGSNNTGTPSSAGLPTLDDDRPTISISSPNVTEGSDAYAVFTVSLNKTSTEAISFTPVLAGDGTAGKALLGTDTAAVNTLEYYNGTTWVAVSGPVSIAAGQSSVQLRLALVDDTTPESLETFTLATGYISGTVLNPTGATGTASISDNDAAPSFSVDSVVVNEGIGNATFTVTRNGSSAVSNTVNYATSDGSATLVGLDYTATSGTLTFGVGITTQTFTVAINNDGVYEGSENFTITLTNPVGTNTPTISSPTGTGTIKDDGTGTGGTDSDLTVAVTAAGPVDEASPYAMFTITATPGQTLDLTLGNTATTSDADATISGFTVMQWSIDGGSNWTTYSAGAKPTVPAGGTVYVRVAISSESDNVFEGAETFTLKADITTGAGKTSTGTATIIDDGTGTKYPGTIAAGPTIDTITTALDNDTPTVSVNSVTVSEASPYAVFEISLSNASASAISFTPSLSNGTATVGTDTGNSPALEYYNGSAWVSASSGITMPAGATSVLVRTAITNDTTYEGSETFTLSTGAITGTVTNSGAASGTGTIKDDGTSTNVFNSGNNSATPTAGAANDDRTLGVTSPTVNEASPYAVFTVSGVAGQNVSLVLAGVSAGGTDFGAADATNLQVSLDNGLTWTNYTAAVTLPAGGSILVRTPVIEDSISDNNETLTLTATPLGGAAAVGTATIKDDGTGTIYNTNGTVNAGATKSDDTPVTASAPPPTPTPAPLPTIEAPTATVTASEPPSIPVSPFNSAVAMNDAPKLPAERNTPAIEETLTSSSGFRAAVAEAAAPNLAVFRGITDQFIEGNKPASFVLPYDAFVHTRPEATIILVAKLANGDPLPAWVQFDPRSGTFQLNPPTGFSDELQIQVIARDGEGREASSMFRFFVGEKKASTSGRDSLSDQIRVATKRSSPWLEMVRPHERNLPADKLQRVNAQSQLQIQRTRV